MILTVTTNPSIDTRYQLDKLVIDDVNRVTPEKTAGGKGLNVSRVLLQLGDDVLATGLLGGHMGAYMAELMDADGVKNDFVPIAGETRICLNILHEGNQTELLESGPQIAPAELEAFTAKFAELAAKADVVTLSGSLPRGVDAGYYAELVKIAEEAAAKVLLDTSGASLEAALESDAKPELVKPNLTEINGLLGTSFTTDDVDALREALAADGRFAGIPWVVVSMGAAGSVGFHEGRAFRAKTPAIAAVNATGSGDSTIAGFAHAIAAGADDVTVLKTANACGKLYAHKLQISAVSTLTVPELELQARNVGAEVVIVDYLGLLSAEDKRLSEYDRVTQISGDLKRLAKRLGCVVLALCQLNRESVSAPGQDTRPRLSQLRSSGAIEQDSDGVLLLHRPEYGRTETPREASAPQQFFVAVAKNRHGRTGTAELAWYAPVNRFEDYGGKWTVKSWM